MTKSAFENLHFSAFNKESPISAEVLKPFCKKVPTRIMDLGCGTGNNLFMIEESIPNVDLMGIDISATNISQAEKNAEKNSNNKISFQLTDYLNYITKPFDIIYADSVLHLIVSADDTLFQKLSKDLLPHGVLIVTMPYSCLYNNLLIGLRCILRCFRTKLLDAIILKVAALIYPSTSLNLLKDRIPYMYMIPQRIDSSSFRKLLKRKYQLSLISSSNCPKVSFAKLKHKLLVFQKII